MLVVLQKGGHGNGHGYSIWHRFHYAKGRGYTDRDIFYVLFGIATYGLISSTDSAVLNFAGLPLGFRDCQRPDFSPHRYARPSTHWFFGLGHATSGLFSETGCDDRPTVIVKVFAPQLPGTLSGNGLRSPPYNLEPLLHSGYAPLVGTDRNGASGGLSLAGQ